MENSMKNFYRTFIVYSSLLINNVNFYLSCSTRETSEIIFSLISKNKPKISFEELKKSLISRQNQELMSFFPYFNCFELVSLGDDLMNFRDIGSWNKEKIIRLINTVLGNNFNEMTIRSVNYLMKIGKILK